MSAPFAFLASTRLMLAGLALLAAGMFAVHDDPAAPAWPIVAPLVLLALNLAAAIGAHRRLRRGGLGVFHVALLALLVVAAGGRLARLEGRVELTEGQAFTADAMDVTLRGTLHPNRLSTLRFVQGPYRIDYAPGVRRSHTRSEVAVVAEDGVAVAHVVGDDTPLALRGYRFYTTHNKGFAPVLTWTREADAPVTGSLHMPSYPLFDWKQENTFTPPGGTPLRVFVDVRAPLAETSAWTLDPRTTPVVLVVHDGDTRHELAAGQSVRLGDGTLRFDRMVGWMGYKVFFDPTLPWLFVLAVVGVGGLGWHLWRRAADDRVRLATAPGEELPA